MDTAIRNYALTIDALYLKWILPDDNDVKKIETRINKDASFTIADFTEFDEYSNWGLIKMILYATYLIICGANDIDEYECCIMRLLNNQIRKDGGHIENSNMYHVQILICLLRLIYWAENNEVVISEEIKDKARKMALFTYRLCDPLGNQIMYGDSDYTSTNTVLFIASELLDFNYTLNHGEPDDYILFYEFPTLISKVKLKSKKKEKKVQNIELDGGIWCFDNDDWCIRAFNESSKSGHKHADNGEIVVYYHSRPVIIDAGRCTYYEPQKRMYYRGPFSHNIAVIDNAEEWEPCGNWEFKENPSNIYNKKESRFPGYKMSYVFSSKQYVFKSKRSVK